MLISNTYENYVKINSWLCLTGTTKTLSIANPSPDLNHDVRQQSGIGGNPTPHDSC